MNFYGYYRIIENPLMTEAGEPIEVRRSWKERLFTRPWRPFQSTRTIVPQVPSKQFIVLPNWTIIAHPAVVREFKKKLNMEGGE